MNTLKGFFEGSDCADFAKRVLPIQYLRRGIYLSEAFAICHLCDYLNVDVLIESGTAQGRSTEIFAKFGIPSVITIDRVFNKYMTEEQSEQLWSSTKERLAEYKSISFMRGEAKNVIKDVLDQNKSKKVALFIDGPKGREACLLGKKHLKRISFLAIHDQVSSHGMSKYFPTMYTDERWYRDRFGYLDKDDFSSLRKRGELIPDDFPGQGLGVTINKSEII